MSPVLFKVLQRSMARIVGKFDDFFKSLVVDLFRLNGQIDSKTQTDVFYSMPKC